MKNIFLITLTIGLLTVAGCASNSQALAEKQQRDVERVQQQSQDALDRMDDNMNKRNR